MGSLTDENAAANLFYPLVKLCYHSLMVWPISWFAGWRQNQPPLPISFNPAAWRPVIWAITNIFETGVAEGNPAALQTEDGGIISYGKHQATVKAGMLAQLIERYGTLSQTPTRDALMAWLPRLQAMDPTLRHESVLHDLLRAAAAEPAMGLAQDDLFDEQYYQPAIQRAQERGLYTPLALACLYDAGVQGGRDHILARLTSPQTQSESQWIAQFLTERTQWLNEIAQAAAEMGQFQQAQFLRNSRFRVDELGRLLRKGNLLLRGRIRLRGQTIAGIKHPQ
ncbi:MAG: chitosanase [Anaerolineae bacterium]|nr:chitosanase [Anaerolineae bacterium]